MKYKVYLPLLLLLTGLVYGCHHDDVSSPLHQAEEMIAHDPCQAVSHLSQLLDSVKNMSQDDEMYAKLLLIRAMDKAYMPLKDTDGIERIVSYFEQNENSDRLPMAYYYAGRTFIENKEALEALTYFLKAEDLLMHGEDDRLYTVLCSQIADIYSHRYMFDDARAYLRKAYVIDSVARDTFSMVSDLRDMAVSYSWDENEKESMRLLREAHALARQAGSLYMMAQVEKDIAYSYKNQHVYDSALYYIHRPIQRPDLVDKEKTLPLVAAIYQQQNKMDSAAYYARMLLEMPSVLVRNKAHKILALYELQHGDANNAKAHILQHYMLEDTADMQTSTEAIARAKELFAQHRQQQENNNLRLKNKAWRITGLTVIIILLAVIATVVVWFVNHKRERLLMQLRYEHMLQIYQRNKETYNKMLLHNEEKMAELQEQLKYTSKENTLELTRIHQAEDLIEKENTDSRQHLKMLQQQTEAIRSTEICQAFHAMVDNGTIPSEAQWQQLEQTLNHHFDNFIPRLEYVRPLNVTEKRVCMLLKIEMRPSDIAKLLCKETNTISSVRTRLCKKFCLDRVTSSNWDTFIKGM